MKVAATAAASTFRGRDCFPLHHQMLPAFLAILKVKKVF
jgi:hypothetical protein